MNYYNVSLSILLIGAGYSVSAETGPLQVQIPVRFLEVDNTDLSSDIGIDGILADENSSRNRGQLQTGFDIRGFAQTEYRRWNSGDDLAIGGKVNFGYGLDVGGGIAQIGLGINGEYTHDWGESIYLNPYVAFELGDSKISVGRVKPSFDYVIRPFHSTASFARKIDGEYPLGIRFDTAFGSAIGSFGDTRLSASYDEYDNISFGAKYKISPDLKLYGAFEVNTNSNYTTTGIGLKGHTGDLDYRVGMTIFQSGGQWLEGEASYDVNDKLTVGAYIGADIWNGSTELNYAAIGEYSISDSISLNASIESSSFGQDFTLGALYKFGNRRSTRDRDSTIIMVTPRIINEP